jgi:hypothetical protein
MAITGALLKLERRQFCCHTIVVLSISPGKFCIPFKLSISGHRGDDVFPKPVIAVLGKVRVDLHGIR